MSGGNSHSSRRGCARKLATGLVGGLLIAPWGLSVSQLLADDAAKTEPASSVAEASDDCPPKTSEKSIVIQSARKSAGQGAPSAALAHDGDAALEPIANVSEYEPELADDAATPLEPTLADDLASETPGSGPTAPGAERNPSSQDVCIDDGLVEAAAETPISIEAATFNGVVPGETNRSQVLNSWGKPIKGAGTATLTYDLKNFPAVAVTFTDDVVDSIRVELFEPVDAEALAVKLGLAGIRPAAVVDDRGVVTSTIYPERGVTLNHQPAASASVLATDGSRSQAPVTKPVYEVHITRIASGPFVLRAQSNGRNYARTVADLETALQLDAVNAEAHVALSELKLALGQVEVAEQLAAEACELDPDNDYFRLQWARCLKNRAFYDRAVEQTRTVLEGATASKIVRAQALEQMALLAALGSKDVQQRAVPLHNKAIALADELATSRDPAVQSAAQQLLVSAHLAVAEQIAAGSWQDKDQSVAEWIGRASGIAEQMIANGEADVSLRLQVAVSALVAGARLEPPIDPALWIAEAEQAAGQLQTDCEDRLARAEVDWQLGLIYAYSTDIQHRRGQAQDALKYGALAEAKISPLVEARSESPDAQYVLGRLYFQIGAIHAVHAQDHSTACKWYDRAAETLLRPTPITPLAWPQQHGDALVSMGVSYWHGGQRDRAVELTKAGLELTEQAVAEKLLAADAVKVAKNNLAAMNRAVARGEISPPTQEKQPEAKTRVAQSNRNAKQRTAQAQSQRSQPRVANRNASGSDGTRRR